MTERKTKDVLKAEQIQHPYAGNVQKVYIVGEVKHYENDNEGKKTYVQEFFGSYVKPKDDGTFDKAKRGLFRAETTEPFADLTKYADNGSMLLVTGQTFRMKGKDKEGKEFLKNKTFCRSIKEAVAEQEAGKTVYKGGADVMSKDIAVKTEFWKASNVQVNGYVNFSKLNQEMANKEGQVYGYRQTILLSQGKDKDSQKVEFVTPEKIDPEKFAKGEKLSMKGALRLNQYMSKKENKNVTEYVFDPAFVCEFIDQNKDKAAETALPEADADISLDDADIDSEAEKFAFGFNDEFGEER